jgi:ATP-binding protein involved in chromosome partitioning
MARRVKLHVAGVVENMSWFTADDGTRYDLFGSGGGELLARELDTPLLGQVPFVPALRAGADLGSPIVSSHPGDEASIAVRAVAERLLEQAPTKVRPTGLRLMSNS